MLEMNAEIFDAEITVKKSGAMVSFWAGWCGPCGLQEPIIRKLAGEYSGKLAIGRVNVDDHPELADRYEVRTLPTTIFFSGGEILEALVGFQAEEYLRPYLEHLTAPEKAG